MTSSSLFIQRRASAPARKWDIRLLTLRLGVALAGVVAGIVLAGYVVSTAQAGGGGGSLLPVLGSSCGDGFCDDKSGEDCRSCSTDCGSCGSPEPTEDPGGGDVPCDNDGVCEPPNETVYSCGDCPSFCGDGICAREEVSTCCTGANADCPVSVTCGDGICSACENADNCLLDTCAPVETEEPTDEPTATSSFTPTRIPVTTAAASTKTPTPTIRATFTATSTGTVTPTDTPTGTSSPSPTPEPECGLVSVWSRREAWRQGYDLATDPDDFIPVQDEDLEVWVCPVEAGDRLCIPIYDDLLTTVEEDLTAIRLVDCDAEGECRVFDQDPEREGSELCWTVGQAGLDVSCGDGCALSPDPPPAPPPPQGIPPYAIVISVLVLILLLALLSLLLRRRRDREDEYGDAFEGATSHAGTAPVANPKDTPPTLPSLQRMRRESAAETQERDTKSLGGAGETMIETPPRGTSSIPPADKTMIEGPARDEDEDGPGTMQVPHAPPRKPGE